MSRATIRYSPAGPTLEKFHASDAKVRCVIGPLGSGKTTGAIVEVLSLIDQMPAGRDGVRRSRIAVVRNSTVDLKAATIKDWESVCPPQLGKLNWQPPITQKVQYKRPSDNTTVDAEVLFLGYDLMKDTKKIRGLQLTWVWCDEAKELPKEVVDMLYSRCGRYPAVRDVPEYPWGMVLTSNAPARDEWLGKLATQHPPDGWEFFIQPGAVLRANGRWQVNPKAENLPNHQRGYYEGQIAGKSEAWIRANLANEFVHVSSGRPVHPDFNERFHVADGPLEAFPGVPIRVGVDFGRTPAAAIGQCVSTESGGRRWYIIDEVTTTNTSVLTFGEALEKHLKEKYPHLPVAMGWGDPAGTADSQTRDENCFDILSACGLEIFPAHTNDFNLRTSALDNLLRTLTDGEPSIVISPTCEKLVAGLAGAYKFRRIQLPGEDRYADKPVKGPESHVCEALHYLLLGEGEGDALYDPEWMKEFKKVNEEQHGSWAPDARLFH